MLFREAAGGDEVRWDQATGWAVSALLKSKPAPLRTTGAAPELTGV
jgi:hypothetical protein